MSCKIKRIDIPIGSDFKLVIQLASLSGEPIPPDSVAWELRFASREKLYASYIVKSSEMGDKWHEVEGSNKILIPIPSGHSMAPGELCCKIRYSTPDAQFSDDSYDAESTWRIVELGGDEGYNLTLVSASRAGYSKFPEDMEFAVVLPQGERGEAGKAAYESAVEHGYTGTEEEFYQALSNTNFAKEWAEDVLKEPAENFTVASRRIDYHLEKEREAINKKSYPSIPFNAPMSERAAAIDRIEGEIEQVYRELGAGGIIDKEIYINNIKESVDEVASWGGTLPGSGGNQKVIFLKDYAFKGTSGIQYVSNCQKLLYVENLNAPFVTNGQAWFYNCSSLTHIKDVYLPLATNLTNFGANCSSLISVEGIHTTNKVTNMTSLLGNCYKLESVSAIEAGGVTTASDVFINSSKLKHFGGFLNIKVSFNLSTNINLTTESLVNVLNGLAKVTQGAAALTLGATLLAKLTDEQKAIAIVKGWILR